MFLAKIIIDNASPCNILWSNETHFTLERAVYIYNCRKWDTASPNFVHEQFLHPDCITFWYGFAADFILDSLFIRRTFLKVVQDIPSQF